MNSKAYPDISEMLQEDSSGHITLNERDLQKILYNDRYNLMKQKKDDLKDTVRRYMKTKKMYSLANNTQKIFSLSLSSSLTIATIVLTSGLAIPFFLIPTASGLSLFFIGFTASLDKIMKNKKLKIKSKVDSLKELIAKIETYIEKAREDGIIMPEEIKRFNDLLLSSEVKKKKEKEKEKEKEEDLYKMIEEVIAKQLLAKK